MAYGQILGQAQGGDIESIARIINAGWVRIAKWETAGNYTWEAPDLFGGKPYQIGVVVIGGGGSGGAIAWKKTETETEAKAERVCFSSGGASGYLKTRTLYTNPKEAFNLKIGKGGEPVSVTTTQGTQETIGTNGELSYFKSATVQLNAQGGEHGYFNYDYFDDMSYSDAHFARGGFGGQPSGAVIVYENSLDDTNILSNCDANCCGTLVICNIEFKSLRNEMFGEDFREVANKLSFALPEESMNGVNYNCYNPFTGLYMLGAGGGAVGIYDINSYAGKEINFYDEQGNICHGGGGVADIANYTETAIAKNGVGAGCGGGGCVKNGRSLDQYTATSGAGADGAVYIYARGIDPDKYAV